MLCADAAGEAPSTARDDTEISPQSLSIFNTIVAYMEAMVRSGDVCCAVLVCDDVRQLKTDDVARSITPVLSVCLMYSARFNAVRRHLKKLVCPLLCDDHHLHDSLFSLSSCNAAADEAW